MEAILYIGHGTRSKKGAQEARDFLNRIISKSSSRIQEISFLELAEPSIGEAYEKCIRRGASSIRVVPIFLLSAGHIKEDIPDILKELKNNFPDIPVEVADPFGVQQTIIDAVCDLIFQEAMVLSKEDSVLLVGRGSSDPSIIEAFEEIRSGVADKTGAMVKVCFLAAASPTLDEGLEGVCADSRGRIIAVPYLLFGGLLLSEIENAVRKRKKQGMQIIHTGSLSRHSAIEKIVIARAAGKEERDAAPVH
ncbi:sirohydrochlorin chelatase [Bacillus sp. UMB0728]|uniref:sirohydrochlorin chelatase n=1 Tax=Bacillus sp. UMB0728 TaxID=2066052 RepID=UPI000C77343D|nr:sirohydrochlorin chelatase [Bacillus sp. UMB0728]PLR74677.1 sirohydrochlorin chelatase [Bacillus sp. UMB0728]